MQVYQVSKPSRQTTMFTLINDLVDPVKVQWIDFKGAIFLYKTLSSRENYTQASYSEHKWIVESSRGDKRVFTLGEGLFLKANTVVRVSEIDLTERSSIKLQTSDKSKVQQVLLLWKNKVVNGIIYSAGIFIQLRVNLVQNIIDYLNNEIEIFLTNQ